MLNNNFIGFERKNDYHLQMNQHKIKKRIYTSSIEKLFKDNQINKLLSDEQIDENIKQCYNNLNNLRNAFKTKKNNSPSIMNVSKTLESNKYDSSKSINYIKDFSKDSNRAKDNIPIKTLYEYTNFNLNNSNFNNNINSINQFKSPNSIKKIPFKNINQLTLSQDNKFNQFDNKIIKDYNDKNSLMGRSLSHKNNNSVSVTIGDTIYNNQLLFSNRLKKEGDENNNSIKDNYIYFLQKQLDESGKKNKELIQMYKEVEKKCENLTRDNRLLNIDLTESKNQNKELKKKDDLIYKERYRTEGNNNLDDSVILLKNSNEELRKNLMLMTNKFPDNYKNNSLENEIVLLKGKNELLNKKLFENENLLKNYKLENEKLNLENNKLKNQVEDYRNKLETTLLMLQEKERIIINLHSNKEKNHNESKESLSDIIEDKSIKIYKKKPSSDKFLIENKSKNFKTRKSIEEIKLKIPLQKPNNLIKEIQIRKNYETNPNYSNYSDDNLFYRMKLSDSEKTFKEYTYTNPDIDNILSKSFGQNIIYDSFNFIINPQERKLFGINIDSNFIEFDLQKKSFSKHNLGEMKIYDSYDKEFQNEGTIILNTLNGLFILTGNNTNKLYYFNDQTKTIKKVCDYINNHNSGSLFLDEINRRIFCFSGKYNKKVEYYSFEKMKIKEIPELSIERANASYCLINNNKLYSFFGYCFPMNNYTETIEYIDLKLMDRWNYISVSTELDELNIHCFSTVHIEGRSYVYLFGGIKGNGELINDYFFKFDTYGNEVEKIDFDEEEKNKCIFTKNSTFIKIEDNYYLMDDNFNVHSVDGSGYFSVLNYI